MPDRPRHLTRRSRLIVGLMSGTSVDGIDAALVRITGRAPKFSAKVLHHTEFSWPPAVRKRILAAMAPAAATTQEICQLNALIAYHFAAAALKCVKDAGIAPKRITALASHGQTVCHLPPTEGSRGRGVRGPRASLDPLTPSRLHPSTLQLGDVSIIATLTGIPTVGNFRPADIALGGQGAPLVPWADAALLTHPTRARCIQNIGGIANVTFLPAQGSRGRGARGSGHSVDNSVLAFDTGPGNMLIDALITLSTRGRDTYDKNGHHAARGALDLPLFRRFQSLPYFSQRPPKSTGRELFGAQLAKSILETGHWKLETLLHTATYLTAWSIADAYLQFLPELPREVILCGGGADNPTLVSMLTSEFARGTATPPDIRRIDEFGIPNKAKEAASFALLAAATLDGVPSNLPSVTGASRPAILGVIAR